MKKIILSLFMTALMSGCAASPDTLIYIDKSIHVPNPQQDVKIDYETNSGVAADSKFDGEVSPDVETILTPR